MFLPWKLAGKLDNSAISTKKEGFTYPLKSARILVRYNSLAIFAFLDEGNYDDGVQ